MHYQKCFCTAISGFLTLKQNNEKTCENLRWLRESTGAHIHADLIFGLPGDCLQNFAKSFDQLVSLNPQEIQLGILKRLRGAPINRHSASFALRYNPAAPYNILSTRDIDFATMQRVNRFARFWDMIANSGRFKNTLPLILADDAFARFLTGWFGPVCEYSTSGFDGGDHRAVVRRDNQFRLARLFTRLHAVPEFQRREASCPLRTPKRRRLR